MKPFPNRTSTFQRIRLSPDHVPLRVRSVHQKRYDHLLVIRVCLSTLHGRLRPFTLLRHCP